MLFRKTEGTPPGHTLHVAGRYEVRKENAMKVLKSAILTLLLTATQVMAYGEGTNGESPSLLMVCFMGFFALIIVCQVFPAAMLFWGMVKGLVSSADKKTNGAVAGSSDKR